MPIAGPRSPRSRRRSSPRPSPVTFYPERTRRLDLDLLAAGVMPGVSARFGGALAEAAAVCLETKHSPGVHMELDGDCRQRLPVVWTPADDRGQQNRTWGDEQEAVEHGAYGVAALLVSELTDYTVVERARKGKGFDFWLGPKDRRHDDLLFQNAARLEVSGIQRGDDAELSRRVGLKLRQITPSDGTLPGVVAVVEFGSPRSRVKNK